MYRPLNYDQINVQAATYLPSQVKNYNNIYFDFWCRSLYERLRSSIIIECPWKSSEKNFLYYCLFRFGYVGVFNHKKYGMLFQPGNLSGFDVYYQPTDFITTNPAFEKDHTVKLKIHEKCELLQLSHDYFGVFDIIYHYAEKLSNLDSAINMSIINSKFAYILAGRNKGAIAALKKLIDKINRGEPTVFVDFRVLNDTTDKEQPFQFIERRDIKSAYLTPDMLQDIMTILNQFDAEIGITTTPYQKKERMVTAEATSRAYDATARASVWVECLNESAEIIKDSFGIDISARLRFTDDEQEQEGDNNE